MMDEIDQELMDLPTSFRSNLKPKPKIKDDLKGLAKRNFRKAFWKLNPDGKLRDRSFKIGRKIR